MVLSHSDGDVISYNFNLIGFSWAGYVFADPMTPSLSARQEHLCLCGGVFVGLIRLARGGVLDVIGLFRFGYVLRESISFPAEPCAGFLTTRLAIAFALATGAEAGNP